MLKLLLMGTPDLRGPDDAPITAILAQPKRLALLGYLAVHSDGFVRRDDLTAMFWPDLPQERARNSLSRSLSFLRGALGDDVIVTRGKQEIRINTRSLWCDAVTSDGRTLPNGLFMDGFRVERDTRINHWIEQHRSELELLQARRLDGSTETSSRNPEPRAAVRGGFVGRSAELLAMERLVSRGVRLITICGAGGMGKSRLATEFAQRHRNAFVDGTIVVSLASLPSDASPIASIAQEAGCQLDASVDPGDRLRDFLRDKSALLVLDNVEHLAQTEIVIRMLLSDAPKMRIMVTSRRPLELRSEHVVRLHGLPSPPDHFDGDLAAYEASALFRTVAEQRGWMAQGSSDERCVIAAICRYLGGLPLGIEIAASWSATLGPEQVYQALLLDPSALLTVGSDVLQRHRSLRTLMESSWDLLTPDQQLALARLSIMKMPADVRTCVRIGRTDLLTIRALTDHAFLLRTPDGNLAMHEMLRAFLSPKLAEFGDDRIDAERAYGDFLVQLLAHDHVFHDGNAIAALELMDRYVEDVREACMMAARRGDEEILWTLLATIEEYYETRSGFGSARDLFAAVHSIVADAANLLAQSTCVGRIRARIAYFDLRLGKSDHAMEALRVQLETASASGDVREVAYCSLSLGLGYRTVHDYERGFKYYSEGLRAYHELSDKVGAARSLVGIAATYVDRLDLRNAELYFRRALSTWDALGDHRGVALTRCNLGVIASELHSPDEAIEMYRSAAIAFRRVSDWRMLTTVLSNWARVCILEADPADARPLLEEAMQHVNHQGLQIANVYLNFAAYYIAQNELPRAYDPLRECLTLAHRNGDTHNISSALLTLAELMMLQKKPESAAEIIGYYRATIPDIYSAAWIARVEKAIAAVLPEETRINMTDAGSTMDVAAFITLLE